MYRFVFAVIVLVSFLSCVLAEPQELKKKIENCKKTAEYNASVIALKNCFNDTVSQHLHPINTTTHGKCKNAADMGAQLDSYLKMPPSCNISTNFNATVIKSLIEFSLKNESFKEFYKSIDCVKKYEKEISNNCVKNKVGFFNITTEKKHIGWGFKASVYYNNYTCPTSKNVKDCVEPLLKNCVPAVSEYVASLFDHVRAIGNCDQYNTKNELPPIHKPVTAPWFTTPVKITISVGALVVGIAIIVVVVLRYRNK